MVSTVPGEAMGTGDEVSSTPTDYYQRLDEHRYRPTGHAGGAWQPGEQHMGPVSGVLVHAVERFLAGRGSQLQLCRITYEILGLIPATDFEITVEVVRPGRTIELVEATMVAAGRACVRARCWLLARQDTTAVAGGGPEPMPSPETIARWDGGSVWTGGFITSVQIHPLPGQRPGRTRAWLRTDIGLVEGEPASELARFVGLVDTANGIAVRMPPGQWMFPNVDLSVHLFRAPRGGWVGLDTEVIFGRDGVGLTTSWLHDQEGPVGRAEQILTIRAIPGG
jgi:hypothetical protein